MENKAKPGRPRGFSPGATRQSTHKIAGWDWDHNRLESKRQQGAPEECWLWLGARGPHGNLFGAHKNGQPQMIQANRLIAMAQRGEALDDQSVYMQCGNRWCCNHNHFVILPRTGRKIQYVAVDSK